MADKIVNVPGVGNVAFPDTMDDASIADAIKKQSSVPSLLPQGTAPTSPETAKTPGTQLRDLLGNVSNVTGMGTAGAQIGAMGGPLGMAAGGVLGGVAGALLPPSDAPMTDLGATALDLAASRLPGGGRMIRAGKNILASGLGAALGAQGDKALGFQNETPFGRVAMYSMLATPGAILGSLASEASPAMNAAQRLKSATGVEFPLSASESTGRFGALERMVSTGTGSSGALGLAQDAAAKAAFSKILGAPIEQSLDVVKRGMETQKEARGVLNDWSRAWKAAHPETITKTVDTGVVDQYGKPIMSTTSKQVPAKAVTNWADLEKTFGLTREERDGFFRALRTAPEIFVDQFLPGRENQVRGLLKLRAVMTVLDKSGKSTEAGALGNALVTRFLGTPGGPLASGPASNGAKIAERIETALGSTTTPGHLAVALGPERAAALRDLAEVIKNANPLERVADSGVSLQKRLANYGASKAFFTLASAGAMGTAGSQLPVGNLLLGAAGGAIAGLALPTAIGAVMMNPALGKVLIRASKGDATATGRILRTIGSAKWSEENQEAESTSKLQGLFSQK